MRERLSPERSVQIIDPLAQNGDCCGRKCSAIRRAIHDANKLMGGQSGRLMDAYNGTCYIKSQSSSLIARAFLIKGGLYSHSRTIQALLANLRRRVEGRVREQLRLLDWNTVATVDCRPISVHSSVFTCVRSVFSFFNFSRPGICEAARNMSSVLLN